MRVVSRFHQDLGIEGIHLDLHSTSFKVSLQQRIKERGSLFTLQQGLVNLEIEVDPIGELGEINAVHRV